LCELKNQTPHNGEKKNQKHRIIVKVKERDYWGTRAKRIKNQPQKIPSGKAPPDTTLKKIPPTGKKPKSPTTDPNTVLTAKTNRILTLPKNTFFAGPHKYKKGSPSLANVIPSTRRLGSNSFREKHRPMHSRSASSAIEQRRTEKPGVIFTKPQRKVSIVYFSPMRRSGRDQNSQRLPATTARPIRESKPADIRLLKIKSLLPAKTAERKKERGMRRSRKSHTKKNYPLKQKCKRHVVILRPLHKKEEKKSPNKLNDEPLRNVNCSAIRA